MRPVTHIAPVGPPESYRTYGIVAPEATHFRVGSCEEVNCAMWRSGWVTVVDETTDLGQRQAHYIRRTSGRAFTETREMNGTVFTFPAGEACFGTHHVRLEREEVYVVRGGDWRGNPRGEFRVHDGADDWQEDFAEHQERIDKAING